MISAFHRLPGLFRPVAVSTALAFLFLIDLWETAAQIRAPQSLYLSLRQPTPVLEWGVLLNTALFTGLFLLLITASARRRPSAGASVVASLVLVVAAWFSFWHFGTFVTKTLLIYSTEHGHAAVASGAALALLRLLGFGVVPAALLGSIVAAPNRTWRIMQAAALMVFPFAAWSITRATWQAVFPPELAANTKALSPAPSGWRPKPLVVWLIFDEMDYHAAFGTDALSKLPNLRLFQQTSFHAGRALEPAQDTLLAIPAYTTGRTVANVRWESPDDLLLRFNGADAYVPWTAQRNIFRDASEADRRTAIIGYLHPYCRLFGIYAAMCEAPAHPEAGDLMKWWSTLQSQPLYRAALLETTRVLPLPRVRRFDGAPFSRWELAVFRHVQESNADWIAHMRTALLRTLADPTIDFVYAHLPLPHPPDIRYLPGTTHPLLEQGYVGNLIAADHLLGEIRQVLVSSARWDSAAVVLTSDHSVRPFWKDTLLLSPSLLRAIKERTEPSVPFMVKLPGQTQPRAYSEPFNAVLIHGIIKGLLAGAMQRPDDIAAYISCSTAHKASARAE